MNIVVKGRRPSWLRVKARRSTGYHDLEMELRRNHVATVCQQSGCPNIWDCFSRRHTTFLILGTACTRRCGYCQVAAGQPNALDLTEPQRIRQVVEALGIDDVIITSVTRDDLDDGGSELFAATIKEVRGAVPKGQIEALIPDFRGEESALKQVAAAGANVIAHNIETVKSRFSDVRPQADYDRSLFVLEQLAGNGHAVKSGLMLGLGETKSDLFFTFKDLVRVGVGSLTIGQYLQPSRKHVPVARYWLPQEFAELQRQALSMGFRQVVAGPLARSSYRLEGRRGLVAGPQQSEALRPSVIGDGH